jgi:hypothetical protein
VFCFVGRAVGFRDAKFKGPVTNFEAFFEDVITEIDFTDTHFGAQWTSFVNVIFASKFVMCSGMKLEMQATFQNADFGPAEMEDVVLGPNVCLAFANLSRVRLLESAEKLGSRANLEPQLPRDDLETLQVGAALSALCGRAAFSRTATL